MAASPVHVLLTVEKGLLPAFCVLTGVGFAIRAAHGASLRELLCGRLGIDPGCLRDRIQTVFLNGRAVADPDSAVVTAGSTIALSAAMPGIAGAMLRKGRFHAPARSRPSRSSPDTRPASNEEGEVVVKLFNLLQQEIGGELLRQGIRIPGRAFGDLLDRRPRTFRSGVLAAEVDGRAVRPQVLFDTDWTRRDVLLEVHVAAQATS
jgi:hypothetical protein